MNRLLFLLSLLFSSNLQAIDSIPTRKKLFISQFVEHPALNETTKGIVDILKKNYGDKIDIRVESAQANAALAQQIANKFVNQQPDIVVGVATIAAQSFAKAATLNKAKLVFSTVTDPIKAGLGQCIEKPGNNISGVSNFMPLEPQIELFLKLQPNLKKLGIIYNPGELNSIAINQKLDELLPKMGITFIKQAALKTADVPQAATKLASLVDAIFISNDGVALSALQAIIKVAQSAKMPVYVSDTDAVELGATAALGPNQYQVGAQTGEIIIRLLNGEESGSIPIQFPETKQFYLNLEAASKANISIPEDLLKSATKIYQRDVK
ncbi:MAG: ABC transporter substrate-binding protein [Alphaproteobacteria bacterium]|nr:ABC transporter substrate-binding protein [Alphaproteobacteria bacterium]